MSTIKHMCISVRGMLRWDLRETKKNLKWITKDDGSRFSGVDEFREYLLDEISMGHEVLPMSDECEGFDYKTGCPGHRTDEVGAEEASQHTETHNA